MLTLIIRAATARRPDPNSQRTSVPMRWLTRLVQRASDARRQRRECEILLRMTARELRDIGLTRNDALAICRGWTLSRDARSADQPQTRNAA